MALLTCLEPNHQLKWDLEKLGGAVALGTLRRTEDGAGARDTFRRTIKETGDALASLLEEQILHTA